MKKIKTNIFLIGSIFLCVIIASCSKTDKNALFQQKLNSIDSSIQEGSTQKALGSLRALRKKAQVPIQYLSIAKRELQLHSSVQALQSIQAGLKKYPDDSKLKAVLTHTLMQEGRTEDAAAVAESLEGTSYAGIGAEALIQADKINQTYRTPVSFWRECFRLTGAHIFLENAAVMLAHKGEIAQAAAPRSRHVGGLLRSGGDVAGGGAQLVVGEQLGLDDPRLEVAVRRGKPPPLEGGGVLYPY